jgi:uncharacterized protein
MIIKKNNLIIANKIKVANHFFSRLIGLLFRKNIDKNFGILFPKSAQMHTMFMLCSIDIIFLNKDKLIIKIYHNIAPFKITKYIKESKKGFVLELKAGTAKEKNLQENDILTLEI